MWAIVQNHAYDKWSMLTNEWPILSKADILMTSLVHTGNIYTSSSFLKIRAAQLMLVPYNMGLRKAGIHIQKRPPMNSMTVNK